MNEGKNKKVLLVIALVSFVIALVIVGIIGSHQRFAKRSNMMGFSNYGKYGRGYSVNNITYAVPSPAADISTFNLPQNAAKSGEIAITVESIESAKKGVTDVASQNEGSVYSSFIAYSSNEIKNGSMTIVVPIDKFDSAFAELRNVGKQVIQESTQQIEKRNFYPMAQSVTEVDLPEVASDSNVSSEEKNIDTAQSAIAIAPIQSEVQDKGYIKIVFADYGAPKVGTYSENRGAGSMMNNQYASQDIRKILLIGFAIKLVFLLVLIFLLGYLFKKMFGHFRLRKQSSKNNTRLSEKKSVAHVRQARIINKKK